MLSPGGQGDYDYVFKLILIGDPFVGKSSLVLRFSEDTFNERSTHTIGVDFKIRTVELDGKVIKLNIWDTAGEERFQGITNCYYRGAHGAIIVYDTTRPETFSHAAKWLSEVDSLCGQGVNKLLIGNKSDLTLEKAVHYHQAQEYADELGIPFIEASAKSAVNVDQAFITMTSEIKDRLKLSSTAETGTSEIINIRSGNNMEPTYFDFGCCSY